MTTNKGIIYKITDNTNNNIYIGITTRSLTKIKNDYIS